MSGSASIVWTLPFTSRSIRAIGAPGGAAKLGRRAFAPSAVLTLAIANGSRLGRLVQRAGIGNSLDAFVAGRFQMLRCRSYSVITPKKPQRRYTAAAHR